MMFLEILDVQQHLRITSDDEDTLLVRWMTATCDYLTALTGNDYSTDPVPASVYAAGLLLVADLFENREASSPVELKENPAVMRLLAPYRAY